MKKLSAVSYLLILYTTIASGHNPEVVNWDRKTFDKFFECMSGDVSDRTQSDCGRIIKEWSKANRKNSEDSTTIEITPKKNTIEITPKKKDDDYIHYIEIRIKKTSYDDTMRKIYASNRFFWQRKHEHKINSNPFVCNTYDKDVIETKVVCNIIRHDVFSNIFLRWSLYDKQFSYDMAKPQHLKKFFIPYALKQLENRITDDDDMENFISPCIKLSNYPGNTQNPQEVKSTLLPLSKKLNKLRIYIDHGSSTDEKEKLSRKLSNLNRRY